jgi:NCAIR mutase (PurE)-related protein
VNRVALAALLDGVRDGTVGTDEALRRLAAFPAEDLGFARLDHQRGLRQGRPEVIYAEGKRVEQVVAIAARLVAAGGGVLATRTSAEQRQALAQAHDGIRLSESGRTAWLPAPGQAPLAPVDAPLVLVVAAGTSDLSVADEAVETLRAFGRRVECLADVGVAGLHRLLAEEQRLRSAAVLIVVAGMEGALASVVGGLVAAPVIAVPTSVGYGAAFGGLAALLAMLNACASGITVTNIDNGFGAAVAADRILAAQLGGS